jgi:hypothetical protein
VRQVGYPLELYEDARSEKFKTTHDGFSDSVIRDFYGKEERENVQTAATASCNLHFATSFTVWPNQLYDNVRTQLFRFNPNMFCACMSECRTLEIQALHKLISSGFTAYCPLSNALFCFVASKLTPTRFESQSEQLFSRGFLSLSKYVLV